MITRALQSVLRRVSRQSPIVTLTGPRQAGKTTLIRDTFPNHDYASLEDPDQRTFALEDPRGFLDQFRGPAVLDEVQRAPDLLSYVQTMTDASDAAGQFILSGSQNFLSLQTISQSLAGRSAMLHLLPFSLSELERRRAFAIANIGRTLPRRPATGRDVMETLFRGFYPRIHDKGLDPQRWLRDYAQTYVERDVRQIVNVDELEAFRRFVRLCAGRNGQLLNLSALGNDCGVTHTTVRRWLSVLEASFLVVLLRPHHRNFNKRLVKSPKLYFLDTGLVCYLLGIRSPEQLRLHSARGGIFASFVLSELFKGRLHAGLSPDCYFWRDSTGHEIDILLEDGADLIALEVKSGQTVASDFLKGIRYWRALLDNPEAPAAIVYAGDRSFRREGVTIYRWSDL